jgi:cytidine deaminase
VQRSEREPAPPNWAEALLASARTARANAYAPYSSYPVGAAVLAQSGNVYAAANVENASFGLTICAERAALFSAVAAEGPEIEIVGLAVLDQAEGACSPCGACRQVIRELAPNCIVIFESDEGLEAVTASSLLPHGFALGLERKST